MKLLKRISRRTARRLHGFTIAETVVGMGVLGILIIALYAGLTSGYSAVQVGREDMRATQILVKKMDQIRLFNWEQITTNNAIPTSFFEAFNPEDPTPTNNVTGGHGNGHGNNGNGNGNQGQIIPLIYSGTVTISAFPDNTPVYKTNMMQVTIQVDWQALSGMSRSRSLTTFVSHYGLQTYIF